MIYFHYDLKLKYEANHANLFVVLWDKIQNWLRICPDTLCFITAFYFKIFVGNTERNSESGRFHCNRNVRLQPGIPKV